MAKGGEGSEGSEGTEDGTGENEGTEKDEESDNPFGGDTEEKSQKTEIPIEDSDEDQSEHSESDESDKTPHKGPLIDEAIIPTQDMLAMANPYLNPLHPLHPFKHEFNVQHHYQTPHGMVTYSNGTGGHGEGGSGMDLSGADMASFDRMMGLPEGLYPDSCRTVQNKALKIANRLMKDYNRRIFRKIMSYLLKSKFLIGMSEIKLNHIMRRKIYNVMSSFSRVSKSNVEFVHSSQEPTLSDDEDSIDSDVQSIDFSNMSDEGFDKGTAGEMYDMLNKQMETQGNVHLED